MAGPGLIEVENVSPGMAGKPQNNEWKRNLRLALGGPPRAAFRVAPGDAGRTLRVLMPFLQPL